MYHISYIIYIIICMYDHVAGEKKLEHPRCPGQRKEDRPKHLSTIDTFRSITHFTGSAPTPFSPETGLGGRKPIENREGNGNEGHHEPRFPEESRLYTGSIFRPLLDTKTRIGSQGYVLSDGMGSSSFFMLATWVFRRFFQGFFDKKVQVL